MEVDFGRHHRSMAHQIGDVFERDTSEERLSAEPMARETEYQVVG